MGAPGSKMRKKTWPYDKNETYFVFVIISWRNLRNFGAPMSFFSKKKSFKDDKKNTNKTQKRDY